MYSTGRLTAEQKAFTRLEVSPVRNPRDKVSPQDGQAHNRVNNKGSTRTRFTSNTSTGNGVSRILTVVRQVQKAQELRAGLLTGFTHHTYGGFTLIELLVVISIIALLMAILMPSLQRTRDQAKSVVCQTQLKHWGIVFSMYTGDNNGYFHRGHKGSSDFKGNWFNATMNYWQDPAILRCPMARVQKGSPQRGNGGKFTAWYSWLGNQDTIVAGAYAINGWVQNPPPGEDTKGHDSRNNWRTFFAKTAHPVPLLLDSWWYYGYPYETDTPTEWDGQVKAGEHGMDKFCIDRHRNGTTNGLFLDQSVLQVRLKQLWRFKWHKSYNVNALPPDWANEAPWMVGLPE